MAWWRWTRRGRAIGPKARTESGCVTTRITSCDSRNQCSAGEDTAAPQQIGTRVVAWWRAPVRRAWLAVAAARARVRKGECGGVLINLHQDVQTCGYQDVQVMWDMLSSDKDAIAAGAPRPKQRTFWSRLRPFWPASSGATTAAAVQ